MAAVGSVKCFEMEFEMDRAQEKFRRLLIVKELVSQSKPTTKELRRILAERFAITVSYRTARRDLALIRSVEVSLTGESE